MSIVQLTNSWISLFIAIIFGVFGTIALKLSHGFINLKYIYAVIVYYAISFIALTYAVEHMELSVVYAIWSGVGTLLVALVGVFYFKEPMTFKKALCLCLIALGVIGIHFNVFT